MPRDRKHGNREVRKPKKKKEAMPSSPNVTKDMIAAVLKEDQKKKA